MHIIIGLNRDVASHRFDHHRLHTTLHMLSTNSFTFHPPHPSTLSGHAPRALALPPGTTPLLQRLPAEIARRYPARRFRSHRQLYRPVVAQRLPRMRSGQRHHHRHGARIHRITAAAGVLSAIRTNSTSTSAHAAAHVITIVSARINGRTRAAHTAESAAATA